MRYRLQRKEPYVMPNIIGNRSIPVHTYRWKDILASDNKAELKKYLPADDSNYRIEDTRPYDENGHCKVKMKK